MMAIHEIPLEKVSYYGVTSGKWINKERTVMQISNITEKPTVSYAEENLGVEVPNNGVVSNRGEIELTTALEQVRKTYGMIGVQLNGKMYDMGNPEELRNTINCFGKN